MRTANTEPNISARCAPSAGYVINAVPAVSEVGVNVPEDTHREGLL